MSPTPLVVLYVLIGVGCAIALVARQGRAATPLVDMALLLAFWPLFGPFVLARPGQHHGGPSPTGTHTQGEGLEELLMALRRAGGAPLASLLPDLDTGRRLQSRLEIAARHVSEIDRLLGMEQYSEDAALARQADLQAAGDTRSAEMVDGRLQIIGRLRRLRDHFDQEINQISELLTQLQLQAELVRIAGTASDDTRDLVLELVTRIQGLEELMAGDELEALAPAMSV